MMGELAFARPWWLLALPPLALLVLRLWRTPHLAATAWKRIVDAHLLPHVLADATPGDRRAGLAFLAAGLVLAVLALAGPTLDRQPENAYRRNAVRVLVVDLSPQAAPQIERIKAKAEALLRALPEGETALLVYADEPYLVVPPTSDVGTIARFIPELATDAVPVQGNRPERAFAMARTVLARNAASSQARDVIWLAASANMSLESSDPDGVRLSLLHAGEQDAPALAAMAEHSGGVLLRMQNDDSDVRQLVATLAQGGDWIAAQHQAAGKTDVGYWLLPVLLLLAPLAFRRGVLMLLVSVLCAGLLAPPSANALDLNTHLASRLLASGNAEAAARHFTDPHWRAIAHYRAGNYDEAARLLEGMNDPDALYNRGNALAKQGRLLDALASYEASLQRRPNDADTRHNRDLVRRLLNQRDSGGSGKQNQAQEKQEERDAQRVAEQWLRGVPDEPQTLLRRKLALEHRQRSAGKAERP